MSNQPPVPVQQLSNPSPYRPYQPPDEKLTGRYWGGCVSWHVAVLASLYWITGEFVYYLPNTGIAGGSPVGGYHMVIL